MRTTRIVSLAFLAPLLNLSLFAATVQKFAVGGCQPNLRSFPNIQTAVSEVPSGATILVCPGTYPEQVLITQPLTLQGVNVGGSGAAVITIPSGGLQQNAFINGINPVAVQLLVENPGGAVNLTNLVIDGTGGTLFGGAVGGAFYQEASGTVSHVAFRHQFTGSFTGLSMLAESLGSAQTVNIVNSTMRDFDNDGIFLNTTPGTPLLTVSIKSNIIRGSGPDSFGIGAGSAMGTVQANFVSEVGSGLDLFNSSLILSVNNFSVVSSIVSQGGFIIDGGTNTLKTNQVDAGSGPGIMLFHSNPSLPNANAILTNTISNSSTAVDGCSGEVVTGNTITGNHIIDASTGISVQTNNTSFPNTYYGVTTFVSPCAFNPALQKHAGKSQMKTLPFAR